MKNKYFWLFLVVASLVSVSCISIKLFLLGGKSDDRGKERGAAASSASSVTSQADWAAGIYESDYLDISSTPGSIKIDPDEFEVTIDTDNISASDDIVDKNNIIDGDINTKWGAIELPDMIDSAWIKIDLGGLFYISKLDFYWDVEQSSIYFQGSTDDSSYTNIEHVTFDAGPPEWTEHVFDPEPNYRYVRFYKDGGPDFLWVNEIVLYAITGNATHTTAATQIDGQEGSADKTLIEWTSFTPTQTTPANTSITYEFRTSANGSDWTNWSAPQEYSGSPLDLTGLTANRYLQVKATLTTTDAGTTPQIDDYTINFHNNQKPNKPTAQTAVIGN